MAQEDTINVLTGEVIPAWKPTQTSTLYHNNTHIYVNGACSCGGCGQLVIIRRLV